MVQLVEHVQLSIYVESVGELLIADVRTHPTLSLFTDFENGSDFKPQDLHLDNVNMMLDQVISWSTALKTVRG